MGRESFTKKERNSNIELYRIIVMLLIVWNTIVRISTGFMRLDVF